MRTGKFIFLQVLAICVVIAQPIFGWHAIPQFFNSVAWAIILGLLDGAILMAPVILMRASD